MSIFQCNKCGVAENTALTNAGHSQLSILFAKYSDFITDVRERLGLADDEPLGKYCSECTPIWFTPTGDLGIGPNPNPTPGAGLWHGRFPKKFYPLGTMETGPDGNLREKKEGKR